MYYFSLFLEKVFKALILIPAIVLLTNQTVIGQDLSAQAISTQAWQSRNIDSSTNFYIIQRSFNEYWKDRPVKKGSGWKQYKRWEWFWEQRVSPTGKFPDPEQLFIERPVLKNKKLDGTLGANTWTQTGPRQITHNGEGLGRVNSVTTHPSNPSIIWAGAATGGVWKSTDGGASWTCKTDHLPTLSIADIAIDPTNPDVMYLATGGFTFDEYRVGVLKSTDGGETWNTTGLTRQIGGMVRILINPATPSTLLAASTNGIYRSTNGGISWSKALTADHLSKGAFRDMEFKPGDPSIVYASTDGGTVFRSTNGGASFTRITEGLPTGPVGRTELAVSPADPNIVYALFVGGLTSDFGGLYRSTNSGMSWTLMSSESPNILGVELDGGPSGGQPSICLALAASPIDANVVLVGSIHTWRSQDGGATWAITKVADTVKGEFLVHVDKHCLYFAPGTSRL
ncbi:MAG TPA: hypothetical protein VEC36_03210, partial [Patescibacteria group bacterium]|nr:hypothetical protein [Patescibacteria group bacterium]